MRQATIIKLDDYRLKRQGRNTPLRLVQRPPESESPAASRGNSRLLTALAASIVLHAAVLLAVPRLSPAPQTVRPPLVATIILPEISEPAAARAPSAASPPEAPREPSPPPPRVPARRAEPAHVRPPASRPIEPRPAPLPQVVPEARPEEPPAPPAAPLTAAASTPAATAPAAAAERHAPMSEAAPALPAPTSAAATGLPAAAWVPPRFDAAYLHNPKPAYPRAAIRLGLEGEARIEVLVGPDGKPQKTRLVQSAGHDALDQSALDAVARWRFVPARRGDQPVAARVEVPVRFQLSRGE